MNKVLLHIAVFVLLSSISCNNPTQPIKISEGNSFLNYSKNILDFVITPKKAFDKSSLMFSDQGAWFAYSFPDSISGFGGFSGPFLMTQQNGVWSSSSLSQLVLKGVRWDEHQTNSYNSHLEQTWPPFKF